MSTTASAAGPTRSSGRHAALDVARGLAILGTLATNVWVFTDVEGLVGYLGDRSFDGSAAGWALLGQVLQQAANGKFLGLLTLLFGIGLELQRRSALAGGRPWPGPYPWRAGLLFVDGLVHYLLFAEFDVLMGYAVTGLVVAYLLCTSPRAQRAWWAGALLVHVTLIGLLTALLAATDAGLQQQEPLRPNPYADGSFADLVVFRIENVVLFRLEPVLVLGLTTGLFLLGAQLLRAGVLEARGSRLRRRLLLVGAAAAVPDLALGLGGGDAGLVFARYVTAPLVAFGLLAAVAELVHRRPSTGPVRAALADVGRTALSCYVLQNVVASVLCYGWGFGLAAATPAQLRVPMTCGVYLLVSAVVVVAAREWVRRSGRGPLERLTSAVLRRLVPATPRAPAA